MGCEREWETEGGERRESIDCARLAALGARLTSAESSCFNGCAGGDKGIGSDTLLNSIGPSIRSRGCLSMPLDST